jgi:hypothetical protein
MTQASIQSPAPVFDGDLFTDDVLADPYASYATLRELGPVLWLADHDTFARPRSRPRPTPASPTSSPGQPDQRSGAAAGPGGAGPLSRVVDRCRELDGGAGRT